MAADEVVDKGSETTYRRHGTALPGWGDLSGADRTAGEGTSSTERMSTGQFALVVLLVVGAVTWYVGHVQATQELLGELRQARQTNQELHLRYLRLKSEFNRATGPSVIYDRARALGLEEGLAYGPTIYLVNSDG